MDMIIPFRSRSDAMRLYNALNAERLVATVVNTPPRLGRSCGLSVVTDAANKPRAEEIVRTYRLNSIIGYYKR